MPVIQSSLITVQLHVNLVLVENSNRSLVCGSSILQAWSNLPNIPIHIMVGDHKSTYHIVHNRFSILLELATGPNLTNVHVTQLIVLSGKSPFSQS